jgi:hypothetical protein
MDKTKAPVEQPVPASPTQGDTSTQEATTPVDPAKTE